MHYPDDSITAIESSSNESTGSKYIQHNDKYMSKEEDSPGGTTYWFPIVSDGIEPKPDEQYNTLDEAQYKYTKYAEAGGFNIRKESLKKVKGNVCYRYMVCDKAGKPRGYEYDTLTANDGRKKRKTTTKKNSMSCVC